MNTNKSCGIYKIEYKNLIYIGQSSNIEHRWIAHLSALRNNKHDNSRLQNIHNKYSINNLNFSVIEFCKESQLTHKEQFWADFYQKDKRCDVLNVGEFVDSPMRGRKHSQGTKEKISNSKKGKKLSEKHKQEISKGNKGKVISKETRKKISKALTGRNGEHHSPEWKIENSKLHKGRIKSNRECKNISKGKMGHSVSVKTRKKISGALKRYYENR